MCNKCVSLGIKLANKDDDTKFYKPSLIKYPAYYWLIHTNKTPSIYLMIFYLSPKQVLTYNKF